MTAALHAEPNKPAAPAPKNGGAAPIVLASATAQQPTAGDDTSVAAPDVQPKRKRAGRQTDCRCGGQTASSND